MMLALIIPALALGEYLGLSPRLPMGNFYFNVVFTTAVFILTMLSIPFGVLGIHSRSSVVAAFAVMLGFIESVVTFYVKFYPVLYPPAP